MSETSNYIWKCTTVFEFQVSLSTRPRNPMVLPLPKATRKLRAVEEGEVGIRREVQVLQGLERRRRGVHGLLLSIRRRRKPDCCEWSVVCWVELRERDETPSARFAYTKCVLLVLYSCRGVTIETSYHNYVTCILLASSCYVFFRRFNNHTERMNRIK
jgi:hypothetical protein